MFNPVDLIFNLNSLEFVTLIFIVLYFPRIWAYFSAFKKQERLHNEKKNKLALLIPARNEGKTILPLLESLNNQTYDRSCYDFFVVVKEPDDPVIGYAEKAGAEVFVDQNQRCKGDCLNYGFHEILHRHPGKYDAFLIVDADCVLTPSFMEEMNNAMASGADVINSKKLIKNFYLGAKKDRNLVTDCNCLIWSFMDALGNVWKSSHDVTTMTITTGILLKAHIIEKWDGWIHRSTLTEDMELQRDCALNDYKTFYYSHAEFYIEESPSLKETDKRRSRWMEGLTHADFIFAKRLFERKGFKAMVNNYFMFCLWIVYAFMAALAGLTVFHAGMGLFYYLKGNGNSVEMFKIALQGLAEIYFTFFVPTLIALIADRKALKMNPFQWLDVLFVHPLFYMGYLPIEIHAIFCRKTLDWKEIARVEVEG